MKGTRILVIDNKKSSAEYIKSILIQIGYEDPIMAYSGEEAIYKFDEYRPALILLSCTLQDKLKGIQIAKHIQSIQETPIIYLSTFEESKSKPG